MGAPSQAGPHVGLQAAGISHDGQHDLLAPATIAHCTPASLPFVSVTSEGKHEPQAVMASPSQLKAAIAKIDELIAALQSGALISSGAAPPAPAAAAPAAAPAAAKPAAPAAAAPAAPKQQAKKEKPKKEKAAPAPAAAEGDAISKAQLAVGRVTTVLDHPSACGAPCLAMVPRVLAYQRAGMRLALRERPMSIRSVVRRCINLASDGPLPPHRCPLAPTPLPLCTNSAAHLAHLSAVAGGSEKLWLCKVDIGGGKERQASALWHVPQPVTQSHVLFAQPARALLSSSLRFSAVPFTRC